MVRLNRAVAVSRVEGATAGLALVDALAGDKSIAGRHAFYAVRAGLLYELEQWEDAREAAREARRRTSNASEVRYFDELLAEIEKMQERAVGKGERSSS